MRRACITASAAGRAGDVVSLVEKMKGVGFREALEYLKAHTGSTSAERARRRRGGCLEHPPRAQATASELRFILDDVADALRLEPSRAP